MAVSTYNQAQPVRRGVWERIRESITLMGLFTKGLTTLVLALGAVVIMTPLLYMIGTSFKDESQVRAYPFSILPIRPTMVTVAGKDKPLYHVTVDGVARDMALLKNQPGGKGIFVDPANPSREYTLVIAEQQAATHLDFHPENYPTSLTSVPFSRYFANTLIVTFGSMAGVLLSCSLVAYGFSRFRARWLNILFLVLLSTVMLPRQVTLIPLYVFFQKLGWIDTLLPLIVPAFFANAYDVFLLRQFFMSVPLEMDDAAKIDGASPFQVLWYVVLPQARPALITVAIFHFMYAWNDFYEPLIYLHSRNNWTMAVGLQTFNALYTVNTHLIMAASLVMILPPIILFFFAQRIFTQGVVISGVKG